jgi:hypothetical protein
VRESNGRDVAFPLVQAHGLADVLGAEARSVESAAALDEAVRLYERKGNVAAVALAHSQLQAKQSA